MEILESLRSIQFWRMAVLWTLALICSKLQQFIRKWSHGGTSTYRRDSISPPFQGALPLPVCVITGVSLSSLPIFKLIIMFTLDFKLLKATSGLGREAALALSFHGFYVVLTGRSSLLLSQTIEEIRKQNPDANLKAFKLDVTSFESVSLFKDSLENWLIESDMNCSIQVLINNAGILATSGRLTGDGHDEMMATNYLCPFFLTKVLLPLLQKSPSGSKIVNVSSFTHQNVFNLQVDKETVTGVRFHGFNQYPYAQIYEYSKVFVLLFTYHLHRELIEKDESSKISVIAVDPGAVATKILREFPPQISSLAHFVLKFIGLMQSPTMGISSLLDAVLAPPEASGQYFFGGDGRTLNSSALSCNKKLAEQLWQISCSLFLESTRLQKDK